MGSTPTSGTGVIQVTEPKRKRTGLLLAMLIAVGLAAGIGLGLILGWIVWPVSYTNTTFTDLSTADKENYIVLVAATYAADHDLAKARSRLDLLEAPNTPEWIADLTARYIAQEQNETDIRSLAELAHALGVDTAQMSPYLDASPPPYPQQESAP